MHLTDIIIYPVKSLGGIHLKESLVQREGLQYDRRWMLLDENGGFLTQRTVPKMALVQPEISDGHMSFYSTENKSNKIKILIQELDGPSMPVKIWKDQVAARPVSKMADEWFSDTLGVKCELVKIEDNAMRYDITGAAGKYVSFADSQPFLIIGEQSLFDLNTRLENPVPMNRFRPNFVFSGGEAYVEDAWSEFIIGGIKFKNVKPCARCVLTTVDQNLGAKINNEPLYTLSNYRKYGNEVNFGMLAKVANGQTEGRVKIGYGVRLSNW